MTHELTAGIVFFAVFTQTLVGFGCGLIAMPLLVQLLGIRAAAPLVALVNLTAVGPLWIAAAIGIPTGVIFVKHVDERVTVTLQGLSR